MKAEKKAKAEYRSNRMRNSTYHILQTSDVCKSKGLKAQCLAPTTRIGGRPPRNRSLRLHGVLGMPRGSGCSHLLSKDGLYGLLASGKKFTEQQGATTLDGHRNG